MIQMEVSYETSVDHVSQIELFAGFCLLVGRLAGRVLTTVEECEIREFLGIDHVDAAVKHHSPTTNLNYDTRTSYILTSAKRHNLNWHFIN
jgi:hypothetical protein